MNPKLINYYRDWRRWETATGKLWVILVLGTILLEVILFGGILLLTMTFGIPGENWVHKNMPDWLAIIDLVYIFASVPFLATGFQDKIPLYLRHLLLVLLLVALFFAKVASQKQSWIALLCFIVANLLYLFIKMRQRTIKKRLLENKAV